MSEISVKFPSRIPKGSLGLKLIIVCALVLVMGIPAMFMSYISYERSNRASEVTREVSERYGGEQYISGPILTAPYIQTDSKGVVFESGHYIVFALSSLIRARLSFQKLKRRYVSAHFLKSRPIKVKAS